MHAGRMALRRCLHLGRKIRSPTTRCLVEQVNLKEGQIPHELLKRIVRMHECTVEKEGKKVIFEGLHIPPNELICGILKYTDACITSNTQFSNMISLLSTLPCLNDETTCSAISGEDAEHLLMLFEFLDSYAYDHFFEISDIYPAISFLLKLQAVLNNRLTFDLDSKFGSSVIAPHLLDVARSRRLKSKSIELFMINSAKFCGQSLESKDKAEIAEVVNSSSSRNLLSERI